MGDEADGRRVLRGSHPVPGPRRLRRTAGRPYIGASGVAVAVERSAHAGGVSIGSDVRDLISTWVTEVWNGRRDHAVGLLMAPECKVLVEGVDGDLSVDAFLAYRKAFYEAVPDFHLEIREITAAGTTGYLDWRLRGTHSGVGLGIPPSGRDIHATGLSRFEFVNGRIMRGSDRWNRGEMLASLMRPRLEDLTRRTGLTMRESQVALLMAERLTHVEISVMLRIRPNTARRHCESVMHKLGVTRRQHVARAIGKVPGSVLHRHGSDTAR